jgi:hypothetical protein
MSKGLFRLWIVGTVVWSVPVFLIFREDMPSPADALLPALVPPLIVLAIGAGLVWALRGFRE